MNKDKLSPFLGKLKEVLINFDKISQDCIDFHSLVNHLKPLPKIKYKEGGYLIDDEKHDGRIVEDTIDFENFEYLDITKEKLVIKASGDWQPVHILTIKLVNNKLKVTECKPYERCKEISYKDILKALKIDDEVKRLKKDFYNKNKYNNGNIMEINKKDLNNLIKNIIIESQLDETVFEIEPNDSNMQQKIAKIKSDSSLYDDNKDEIKISNSNESVYNKTDILEMIENVRKERKMVSESNIKESLLSKSDINKMILEKKYNGKLYTKSELNNIIYK